MKSRAFCFGLVALACMSSGCLYRNHPCFGFRLHPCQTPGCGAPACGIPACSSPITVSRPILHPGCSSCAGGGAMVAPPIGYPPAGYAPLIGNAVPIPGPGLVPYPNPMPGKTDPKQ